jgi:hypothetical protein
MVRGQRRDALAIALPVVLVSLLLLGGVGVAVVVLRERSDAQKNDREVAELTRADVTATVDEAVAALAGAASILNEDGTDVDLDRWKPRLRSDGGADPRARPDRLGAGGRPRGVLPDSRCGAPHR